MISETEKEYTEVVSNILQHPSIKYEKIIVRWKQLIICKVTEVKLSQGFQPQPPLPPPGHSPTSSSQRDAHFISIYDLNKWVRQLDNVMEKPVAWRLHCSAGQIEDTSSVIPMKPKVLVSRVYTQAPPILFTQNWTIFGWKEQVGPPFPWVPKKKIQSTKNQGTAVSLYYTKGFMFIKRRKAIPNFIKVLKLHAYRKRGLQKLQCDYLYRFAYHSNGKILTNIHFNLL